MTQCYPLVHSQPMLVVAFDKVSVKSQKEKFYNVVGKIVKLDICFNDIKHYILYFILG